MNATIRILKTLCIFLSCSLLSTTALAQTSMQRRAQEQSSSQKPPVEETRSTQDRPQHPPKQAETIREERVTDSIFRFYRGHFPGVRVDFGMPWGSTRDNVIFGVGLGYMYAMGWDVVPIEQTQAILRFGVGPDLTLGVSNRGVHGVSGFVAARAGVVGTAAGGVELEGALGAGVGQGLLSPAFRIGLFWSSEHFAAGYFYQQVIHPNPPDWMRPHFFALRLHLPVLKQ